MTARFARDEMSFVMPTSFSDAVSARRDTGRRGGAGLGARVVAFARWLTDLPRRQALIAELAALSDHELNDIGLTRADLSRVFDHRYAADRSARRATP